MFRLQVKSHFDAAHYLQDYEGKCHQLHGHRWEVEVVIEGKYLDRRNILVDFGEVKKILNDHLALMYDHRELNQFLVESNVTAEYLVKKIYGELQGKFFDINGYMLTLARVTIWETPECCVKYYGEP